MASSADFAPSVACSNAPLFRLVSINCAYMREASPLRGQGVGACPTAASTSRS